MTQPRLFLTRLLSLFLCCVGLCWVGLISGCASTQKSPLAEAGTTNHYEVTTEHTPFYRLGPQQESGPDLSLQNGRIVTMLKKSYGYSKVELDNGWSGYVATTDIGPATIVPEPVELSANSAIVEHYYVGDEADFPPLPEPDLDITTGVASPTNPEEKDLPRFRY